MSGPDGGGGGIVEAFYYGSKAVSFFFFYGLPAIFVLAMLGVIGLVIKGRAHKKNLERFGIKTDEEK